MPRPNVDRHNIHPLIIQAQKTSDSIVQDGGGYTWRVTLKAGGTFEGVPDLVDTYVLMIGEDIAGSDPTYISTFELASITVIDC